MFVARTKEYQLVSSEKYERGSAELFCPLCGAPVVFRCGEVNAPHFAHVANNSCNASGNDMSWWHLHAQSLFDLSEREVVIKSRGETHRADVCINNTVIEFQNSPISVSEFDERNFFYGSAGYYVIWVFNVEKAIANEQLENIDEDVFEDVFWERENGNFCKTEDFPGLYAWRWPPKTFQNWHPDEDYDVAVFLSRKEEKTMGETTCMDAIQVVWAIPEGDGSSFGRIVLDDDDEFRSVEELRDALRQGLIYVHSKGCKRLLPNTPLCPECGIPMDLKTSRTGQAFWGCRNYPGCRKTKPFRKD